MYWLGETQIDQIPSVLGIGKDLAVSISFSKTYHVMVF